MIGFGHPIAATADVTTSETTTSTSYTDLSTVGPAVTLTPGRTTDQMIVVSADGFTNSANNTAHASVAIAGAAASDVNAWSVSAGSVSAGNRGSAATLSTSVANGSTHTMKYRVTAGTGTFGNRRISAFTLL